MCPSYLWVLRLSLIKGKQGSDVTFEMTIKRGKKSNSDRETETEVETSGASSEKEKQNDSLLPRWLVYEKSNLQEQEGLHLSFASYPLIHFI